MKYILLILLSFVISKGNSQTLVQANAAILELKATVVKQQLTIDSLRSSKVIISMDSTLGVSMIKLSTNTYQFGITKLLRDRINYFNPMQYPSSESVSYLRDQINLINSDSWYLLKFKKLLSCVYP